MNNIIDWNAIDTVLLDMDGTLLDLYFDNHFWLEYLPMRYAEHHNIGADQATSELHARFNSIRGTLNWYCLEHWSRELSINIRALKEEIDHLIQERPFVQDFLRQLGNNNKQRILITNAHPQSLSLKLQVTGIEPLLDTVISSHQYQAPKEEQTFWQRLHQQLQFDLSRTLFVDDTERILISAQQFGIHHLLGINQPDSKAKNQQIKHFPSIHHFNEILPIA